MSRPADWHPLAADDPVPGDPRDVEAAARHYREVSREIARQVAMLKKLAQAEGLVGEYADTIRDKAGEVAGRLAKAQGRYEVVGSALSAFADPLERAQTDSLRALDRAKDAQRTLDSTTVPEAPGLFDEPETPEQTTRRQQAEGRVDDAQEELAAARRQLVDAVDDRDDAAHRASQRIREVIEDDGVKDSWWDDVKDWVDANADWMKRVAEVLSWVATGLAVLAIFIPGVNLLVLLAIAFTVGSLALNTLLAASGNGSWANVALDVFALLTLGLGKVAAQGVRAAHGATRTATRTAVRRAAARQQARVNSRISALSRQAQHASPARRAAINRQIAAERAGRGLRPVAAARQVDDVAATSSTVAQRLAAAGDDTIARQMADIASWRAMSSSPRVAQAAAEATPHLNRARAAFAAGAVVDVADKSASRSDAMLPRKPYLPAYEGFKDRYVVEVGSTW